MSQSRKTLTQHAAEIEQWIAQGWLTGQETFIELQDMATHDGPDLPGSRTVCGCPGGDFGHQRPLSGGVGAADAQGRTSHHS